MTASTRMSPAARVCGPQRSRRRGASSIGIVLSFLLTSLVLAGFAADVASAGSTDPAAPAATPSTASTPTTMYVPSGGVAPGATTAPAATTPGATTTPVTPTTPTATTPTVATPTTSTPANTIATLSLTQTGKAQAKKAKGDRPLSTGAIVIAALALLLLLGCIAWALARRRAFEPHWLLSLRHAMAEAGFRASATWSEFADWARLGR
jgi:hypothetical protein